MKIEKMDTVGVNVKNLEKAIGFFSDIFGIEFVKFEDLEFTDFGKARVDSLPPGKQVLEKRTVEQFSSFDQKTTSAKMRVAIDRTGFFELVESSSLDEGLRSVHFKVADMDKSIAEAERKGLRLVCELRSPGDLREAIFYPGDVYGIRLNLIEYNAPTFADALLENAHKQK